MKKKNKVELFSKENLTLDKVKNYIILILGLVVICFILFRSSNTDTSELEKELESLKNKNLELNKLNDSLETANGIIVEEIKNIQDSLVIKDSLIQISEGIIDDLESKRDAIPSLVNSFSGSDVSRAYTDYLKRRESKNNR